MYCSTCGSAVSPALSYCNSCGAKLNHAEDRDDEQLTRASFDGLVWAIVAVTVGGLGVLIGLMAVMKNELHFNDGIVLLFSLLSFLLIVAADAALIWHMLPRKPRAKPIDNAAQIREMITKELNAAQSRALPESAPSVTEHTTRSIDPIYSERKTE